LTLNALSLLPLPPLSSLGNRGKLKENLPSTFSPFLFFCFPSLGTHSVVGFSRSCFFLLDGTSISRNLEVMAMAGGVFAPPPFVPSPFFLPSPLPFSRVAESGNTNGNFMPGLSTLKKGNRKSGMALRYTLSFPPPFSLCCLRLFLPLPSFPFVIS